MILSDLEKENAFLRKQIDEANQTIDTMAQFQTEEKTKQSFFSWILSLFEGERPFKGWDIGMDYVSSPDGVYVLKIDTTLSVLSNCNKSKSPFHSGTWEDRKRYYNFLKREILMRSRGK